MTDAFRDAILNNSCPFFFSFFFFSKPRPAQEVSHLPEEILLEILSYLSIRDLWMRVRLTSRQFARLADYHLQMQHLPTLKLTAEFHGMSKLHQFYFFRPPQGPSTTGTVLQRQMHLKARECGSLGYHGESARSRCNGCYFAILKALYFGRKKSPSQIVPPPDDLDCGLQGELTFFFMIEDKAEDYRGPYPVVIEEEASAMGVRWNPMNGRLTIDWNSLMNAYCAELMEEEERKLVTRINTFRCILTAVSKPWLALLIMSILWYFYHRALSS